MAIPLVAPTKRATCPVGPDFRDALDSLTALRETIVVDVGSVDVSRDVP